MSLQFFQRSQTANGADEIDLESTFVKVKNMTAEITADGTTKYEVSCFCKQPAVEREINGENVTFFCEQHADEFIKLNGWYEESLKTKKKVDKMLQLLNGNHAASGSSAPAQSQNGSRATFTLPSSLFNKDNKGENFDEEDDGTPFQPSSKKQRLSHSSSKASQGTAASFVPSPARSPQIYYEDEEEEELGQSSTPSSPQRCPYCTIYPAAGQKATKQGLSIHVGREHKEKASEFKKRKQG